MDDPGYARGGDVEDRPALHQPVGCRKLLQGEVFFKLSKHRSRVGIRGKDDQGFKTENPAGLPRRGDKAGDKESRAVPEVAGAVRARYAGEEPDQRCSGGI